MYSQPDMSNTTDRLAHLLSEMDNDRAPIGWERYRSLANLLLSKFPIAEIVNDDRLYDPKFPSLDEPEWLIWSNEHGAWWRPNSMGYTRVFSEAGQYTKEEAVKIAAGANLYSDGQLPNEVAVHIKDIREV